jgi:hypothetical protein
VQYLARVGDGGHMHRGGANAATGPRSWARKFSSVGLATTSPTAKARSGAVACIRPASGAKTSVPYWLSPQTTNSKGTVPTGAVWNEWMRPEKSSPCTR